MKKTTARPKTAVRTLEEPTEAATQGSGGDGGRAVAAERLDASEQARAFEAAAVLFHSGQYRPALERFREAVRGPSREMAHAAHLYARMCQRRLDAADAPRTPEEHYNLAVALVNERRFEAAEQHLRAALAQAPDGDHLYYVLALCRGLGGDLAGAYTHMRKAIELRPQNRVMARNDPDFAEIGQQPPLAELLYPERTRLS
jgi:tetratricopeptide (TPR) repeat protein